MPEGGTETFDLSFVILVLVAVGIVALFVWFRRRRGTRRRR